MKCGWTDAQLGAGPRFADAACGSDSCFCGRHRTAGTIAPGAFDGAAHERALDLSFIAPDRPEFASGAIFFESPRTANVPDSARRTLEQLDLNYFVPCRIREQTVAVLGLGKTVDGDFLSSDDVELVTTIGGYVAVALDNAKLYSSLEQKALEIARLKDFSENIVESLNIGVLAVDLSGIVESWNTRMEQLFGVTRAEAVGRKLDSLLPAELAAEIIARSGEEQVRAFTSSGCNIRVSC